MSTWPLATALDRARTLVALIEPYCKRIEIAGSIRRKKQQVHDIDLVVIWKNAGMGLATVWMNNKDKMSKPTGGAKIIKFTWSFIPVQISVATEKTWPMILLVRTGSAEFNQYLAVQAKRRGMKFKASGSLWRGIRELDITCEQDIFRELGEKFREPRQREKVYEQTR